MVITRLNYLLKEFKAVQSEIRPEVQKYLGEDS